METKAGIHLPLGTLRVGEKLGEGGFGVVHEATIEGIKFPFAIKFLRPSPFNTDFGAMRRRFFNEAETLFKLRHKHIVAIFGVGEHVGEPYILMEHFKGFNLNRARGMDPTPDPRLVAKFVSRIAHGLQYAHEANVVHRDIKPANLMSFPGDARILDFGIASIVDPDGTRLTRTGGTPVGDAFSAPELLDKPRLVEPRCDVYSLGACWFWTLTGRAPKGLNWESELRRSAKVPRDYERVLLRTLAQADGRYQDMTALIADLQALELGEQPRGAIEDELADAEALLLGVVVRSCPQPNDAATFYQVEQELGDASERFSTALAYRKLLALSFIVEDTVEDNNGVAFSALRPTDSGIRYAENNKVRIAELLSPPEEEVFGPPEDDNDLPF